MEKIARILSAVTTPFLIPAGTFILLFGFTYLNIMPLAYKLAVLGIVCSLTLIIPALFICIYKKLSGRASQESSERKQRFVPYLLTIMSYATCLLTMQRMHFPHYLSAIIAASLMCTVLCCLINIKWKVSTHAAGCGILTGGLLSYSFLFYFNPVGWLCGFILLSGAVGSARIIVRQHTLSEVIAGFVTGMFCGITGILFI